MEAYTNALTNISALAWGLSTLSIMLVGSLWYSSFMFGKSWTRHTSIRPHDIHPAEVRRGYILAFFTALFTAYLLGIVASHATSIPALIASIGFVWLFVMFEQLNSFIWERAPFALFVMHAARSLIALLTGAFVHHFIGTL